MNQLNINDGMTSQDDIINLGPEGFEEYTHDGASNNFEQQSNFMQRRFEMQRQLNINPLCLEDFNS